MRISHTPAKKGIKIKSGQVWTIGKGTQKLVNETNNVNIGSTVEILSITGGYGLIQVKDQLTGIKFDLTSKNLGKLISEV